MIFHFSETIVASLLSFPFYFCRFLSLDFFELLTFTSWQYFRDFCEKLCNPTKYYFRDFVPFSISHNSLHSPYSSSKQIMST